MQEAGDEGVILVSFGTIVGDLDEKLLQMMAKAFSKLPQKIIWKLKLEGMKQFVQRQLFRVVSFTFLQHCCIYVSFSRTGYFVKVLVMTESR